MIQADAGHTDCTNMRTRLFGQAAMRVLSACTYCKSHSAQCENTPTCHDAATVMAVRNVRIHLLVMMLPQYWRKEAVMACTHSCAFTPVLPVCLVAYCSCCCTINSPSASVGFPARAIVFGSLTRQSGNGAAFINLKAQPESSLMNTKADC